MAEGWRLSEEPPNFGISWLKAINGSDVHLLGNLRINAASHPSALDTSGKQHLMLGTDRLWILIDGAGKGQQIFTQFGHLSFTSEGSMVS